MRKWKDNENVQIKNKSLYVGIMAIIVTMDMYDILIHQATFSDYFGLTMAAFFVWGLYFNGYYKIARKIKEWQMKRSDNKFDYYSK